jgi:hypothetical protein
MATKKDDELSAEDRAALKEAKKTHGVSEAELANLSEEEREAIEAEDDDAEGLREIAGEGENDEGEGDDEEAAAAKKKGKAKSGPGDDDADAKGKKKGAAAEDADAENAEDEEDAEGEEQGKKKAPVEAGADEEEGEKGKAKAGAEGEGEDDELDVPMRPRLPRYDVKPVEKFDEQMATLDKEYDEALKTYKAGDTNVEDLLTKEREISAKRQTLREAKLKADMAGDFNDQTGKAEWMGDVMDFFSVVKEKEGIDYTKRALNVAFDDALKQLAAVPENKDKNEAWYLRQAHKQVKADLGLAAKKPAADDKGDDEGKGKKPQGRKAKLALVHDLGKIPGAGGEEEGEEAAGGDPEFATLDRLTGQDYEDALVRMSPAKQEKYLRAR